MGGLEARRLIHGRHPSPALLAAPLLLFMLAAYVLPLLTMVRTSLFAPHFTLRFYAEAIASAVYLRVFLNTLALAGSVTALTLLLGYPVALLLATAGPRLRNAVAIAVALPYFTSVLVRSYAWLVLLGQHGIVNEALRWLGVTDHPLRIIYNTPGVLIAMTHILLPVMVFALYSAMQAIDWRLPSVAAGLGATRTQRFFRITLPLSLPAIAGACALVFISSAGFYVTPELLGGPADLILPMVVAQQFDELLNWGFGSALAVLLLAGTGLALLAAARLIGLDRMLGDDAAPETAGAPQPASIAAVLLALEYLVSPLAILPPRAARAAFLALCGAVIAFLLCPILVIFPVSFTSSLYLAFPPRGLSLRWYVDLWETGYWLRSLSLSLQVALITTALALVLATLAALAFARRRGRALRLGYALVLTPMIVPVIVVAVALYGALSPLGLVGSPWGIVIGHLVGACPLVTVLLVTRLRTFDIRLEQAAIGLGASPLRALLAITLPIIRPTLLVAAFFAFMYSFDEVVIASFVGGISAETLPKKMWEGVRLEIKPTLAAISSLLVLFTAAVALAIDRLQRTSRPAELPAR